MIVAVRAQPRSKHPGITALADASAAGARLRIAVSEPPEDGRANSAVCGALAAFLGVPAGHVSVRSGAGARDKLLSVSGDRVVLEDRLRTLAGF